MGIPHLLGLTHFVVTLYLAAILLVLGIGWGLLRSIHQNRCEVPSGTTTFVGTAALVVIGSAFCELQPFIVDAMFGTAATDPSRVLKLRGHKTLTYDGGTSRGRCCVAS